MNRTIVSNENIDYVFQIRVFKKDETVAFLKGSGFKFTILEENPNFIKIKVFDIIPPQINMLLP